MAVYEISGFAFVVCRNGFLAIPVAALRLLVRKLAAICVLCAATGYLFQSGGNVATESVFVIVCVMLGAVLLDHRAISLRPVAVATLIVLVLRPETLSDGYRESNCCRIGEKNVKITKIATPSTASLRFLSIL